MSIKMRIRNKLDAIGKKDKDLAEVLGISRSAVSHRLAGNVEFSHSEIEKILGFLGCKYEEIFSMDAQK